MHLNTTINVIFLCILNASSMLAGIYFNSLVIMSLWRSSQLRKELCYFMILVLSCFDLAVVGINHPVIILSTILWSMQSYHEEIEATRTNTCILLGGFSMFALLTLNIERFLALTRRSIFSSNRSHKIETYSFSGYSDDHCCRSLAIVQGLREDNR